MNFTPENAKKVMDGTKTQTRRIVKDGEHVNPYARDIVYHGNGTVKWAMGKQYAVCPGRGKPAIGRIRITAIRRERVQGISPDDCWAEGISRTVGIFLRDGTSALDPVASFAFLWDSIYEGQKGKQWADNPLVWVLTFEVVK